MSNIFDGDVPLAHNMLAVLEQLLPDPTTELETRPAPAALSNVNVEMDVDGTVDQVPPNPVAPPAKKLKLMTQKMYKKSLEPVKAPQPASTYLMFQTTDTFNQEQMQGHMAATCRGPGEPPTALHVCQVKTLNQFERACYSMRLHVDKQTVMRAILNPIKLKKAIVKKSAAKVPRTLLALEAATMDSQSVVRMLEAKDTELTDRQACKAALIDIAEQIAAACLSHVPKYVCPRSVCKLLGYDEDSEVYSADESDRQSDSEEEIEEDEEVSGGEEEFEEWFQGLSDIEEGTEEDEEEEGEEAEGEDEGEVPSEVEGGE